MLLLDPNKTKTTLVDTEYGKDRIRYTDHFNGSRDVDVKITGLRMSLTADAPPNDNLVRAIAELEAANREWRIAKHSDSVEWKTYSRRRVSDANLRVREVQ